MKLWLWFAVGWTLAVFGAFFLLRFVIPPFAEWERGEQAQLLQAMIGLAGFGAGLVVLVSAVVQLERLTARAELKVSITKIEPRRESHNTAVLQVTLEIENVGGGVCRDWQVALTSTADRLSGEIYGWKALADLTFVYNASGEPLFPRSPVPLPPVMMHISANEDLSGEAYRWSGELRYMMATEEDQGRKRIPIPVDVLVVAD